MANITFKVQSSKSPAEIYIRFRRGREIDYIRKIGKKIELKDWDKEKGQPKHNRTDELKRISSIMSEIKKRILDNIESDILEGKNIDKNWLQNQINPNVSLKIPNKIVEYFDYYILQRKKSLRESTLKKIRTYQSLFRKFEQWSDKNYQINEIDLDFQLKVEKFAGVGSNNYSENYITDFIKLVKTICKNAKFNGVRTNPQTELLRVVRIKVPFTYLNESEIIRIKNHSFENDYLDNARDWLIISCETGQRVGDFMRFEKSMISQSRTRNGHIARYIEFEQEKTLKKMSVLIMPLVEEILNKRNGEFPRKISSQKYNVYIKKICELVGLKDIVLGSIKNKITKRNVIAKYKKFELVASHIGRRSFATNYSTKYPISYLMKQTGHSSERTFLAYIGKTNIDLTLDFADEVIRRNEL
jgi:hypothetical protein